MSIREKEIAEYLGSEGKSFSKELRDRNRSFFNTLNCDYFSIASAIALCWTGHAKYEDDFVNYASRYIDGQIPIDNSIAIKFCRRFGVEGLDSTLKSYRGFSNRIKDVLLDFNNCSIQDINKLQSRLLNKLNDYRIKGEIMGINSWLFLAPFKIILEDQDRFWGNSGANTLILPTGLEVDRGINRLKNEGYTFMKDFNLNWLKEDNGSLLDRYATCSMVHAHIVKIAELADTSALHINSALYLYGRKDI